MQPLHKAVVLCCSFNPKCSLFFFLLFPLRFPADCYGRAATVDSMNDMLLPPGMWTILVSLQNKFNLHFFFFGEREECFLEGKRSSAIYCKLDSTKAWSVFGMLVVWKQQAKLTELQRVLWWIFFSYFVLLLAKVKELMCSKLI